MCATRLIRSGSGCRRLLQMSRGSGQRQARGLRRRRPKKASRTMRAVGFRAGPRSSRTARRVWPLGEGGRDPEGFGVPLCFQCSRPVACVRRELRVRCLARTPRGGRRDKGLPLCSILASSTTGKPDNAGVPESGLASAGGRCARQYPARPRGRQPRPSVSRCSFTASHKTRSGVVLRLLTVSPAVGPPDPTRARLLQPGRNNRDSSTVEEI